tara:strand:- start:165 stop:359 length:195 start_codon:yes stop_codon:yes gene_type:complete
MEEAAWCARLLPGLGNPLLLPIDEFNRYLQMIPKILESENGSPSEASHDHRSHVEAQMRQAHGR